ncbi:MAG: hypothetical protein JWP63_5034, partial [Candidatus Solibacter sp.]|nr:hypothetical protein [Candidatus Solibacter sp.]
MEGTLQDDGGQNDGQARQTATDENHGVRRGRAGRSGFEEKVPVPAPLRRSYFETTFNDAVAEPFAATEIAAALLSNCFTNSGFSRSSRETS